MMALPYNVVFLKFRKIPIDFSKASALGGAPKK